MSIRQSEDQRFTEIVNTYRRPLLAYIFPLANGDTALAEDIVQETFLRAWRRIDRLTADQGSVIGWLRQVARNVAIDDYRMRGARPVETEFAYPGSVAGATKDYADDVLREMAVAELLESLWPEHRAVVVEVYLRDRTTAQAAAALGVPVGTVKSRLHYALRTLRENLDERN